MAKRTWTDAKIRRLKEYLQENYTPTEISRILGQSYDSVRNAIRRYNLQTFQMQSQEDVLFVNDTKGKKIRKSEIDELAKHIGTKIYHGYQVMPLEEPKLKRCKGKREEISILDISDVHMGMRNSIYDEDSGKRIVTYDQSIFLKEMTNLQNSIFQIHGLQENEYKLRKLVVFVLGDIITNDRIFPEQTFEIEKCVGLQIWDAIPVWVQFFNNLLRIYEEIEIVCVVGNHGRSNPAHYNEPVENNFEYFIYRTWQKQFENHKRVKVIVPDTGRYIHHVGPWRHLIEHGHEFQGYSEGSLRRQLDNLYLNVGGFDVVHYGHVHQLAEKRIADKVLVKQNGCWIYKDEYAFKRFKTYSIPEQHFFGCNDKRKETWKYALDLRR